MSSLRIIAVTLTH